MYCVHRSVAYPSSVSHALSARFTSNLFDDLIVVCGASLLQVWRLVPKDKQQLTNTPRLQFIDQWPLFGTISGIQAVTRPPINNTPHHALVISLTDAKLIVLEYDHIMHQLVTVSMHTFENDQSLRSGALLTAYPPLLTVEPSGKCVLALIFQDQCAVLPIRTQDDPLSTSSTLTSSWKPFDPSYVLAASSLDVHDIIDMKFVPGYLEPTLAILHEQDLPTWGPMLDVRRDTKRVVVMSFDYVSQSRHAVLFAAPDLPSSSFALVPIPVPLGGLLVMSANSVTYLSQAVPNGVSAIVNAFPLGGSLAPAAVKETNIKSSFDLSYLGLHLDGAVAAAAFPLPSYDVQSKTGVRVIIGLLSGAVWACDLVTASATSTVTRGGLQAIAFTLLFTSAPLTAIVPLAFDTWVMTSANGPMLVVDVCADMHSDENDLSMVKEEENEHVATHLPKRRRLGDLSAALLGGGSDVIRYTLEEIISNQVKNTQNILPLVFPKRLAHLGDSVPGYTVVDIVPGMGGLKDAAICQSNGQNMIFALTGYGAGSRHVLIQQSIRPRILDKFKVPGARKLWSLRPSESSLHSMLVMTGDQRTMVFRTGQELNQVSDTGFIRNARTIYVGPLCNGSRIVQVLDNSVVLLDAKGTALDTVDMSPFQVEGKPSVAVAATASNGTGQHVVVLSPALVLRVYTVTSDDKLEFVLQDSNIAFASIVTDSTGALSTHGQVQNWRESFGNPQKHDVTGLTDLNGTSNPTVLDIEMDDFDRELYADTKPTTLLTASFGDFALKTEPQSLLHENERRTYKLQPTNSEVLVVIRAGTGAIEMIDLQSKQVRFNCSHVHSQPDSFMDANCVPVPDDLQDESIDGDTISTPSIFALQRSPAGLVQAHVVSLGPRPQDTYLLVVTKDATLLVYQARLPEIGQPLNSDRLAVVWVKVVLEPTLLSHTPASSHPNPNVKSKKSGLNPNSPAWLSLCPFENINGHAGVFATRGGGGVHRQSFWLVRARHGALYAFPLGFPPLNAEGKAAAGTAEKAVAGSLASYVTSFAPFDNVNCSNGFVMIGATGELMLAQLDPTLDFTLGIAHHSVYTGIEATATSYDSESNTIAVASCWDEPFDMVVEVPDQSEHHKPTGIEPLTIVPDNLNRTVRPGYYAPTLKRFRLDLILADNLARGDSITFEQNEQITAIHHMPLDCKTSASGQKTFLIVGTTFVHGEDIATQGRIYVYEPVSVVPQQGRPETGIRLKLQYVEDVKTPVSALGTIDGHLAAGLGNKLICYDLDENEQGQRVLMGMAFHHTNIMVSHLVSLKRFLLVGDMVQSAQLYVLQADPAKLIPLGNDHHSMSVQAAEGMVYEDQASFLVADELCAVHMMTYAPHNIQTFGGVKLLRRGDFFVGSQVSKIVRYQMANSYFSSDSLGGKPNTLDHPKSGLCNLFVCRDGSIGVFVPTSEATYKRLLLLYNHLSEHLPTVGGLHPKAYRNLSQVRTRLFSNHQGTMLDLDLLSRMLCRPIVDQHNHIKMMGSTLTQIRSDVKGLQAAWTLF